MDSMLDEALALSGRGFRIVPIHTPTAHGCSCDRGRQCTAMGKHPRLTSWQNAATKDPGTIRGWWRSWPEANIGIATGGESRLVAVDIDGAEGRATIGRLQAEHDPLPPTLTSRSGRVDGGEHRFFRVPHGMDLRAIKNRAGKADGPMPKVDIRADNGQVVAPPSLHASGNRYTWVDRRAAIAELPAWLYKLATWEPPAPAPPTPVRFESSLVDRARAYLSKIPGAISGQGGHPHTLLVAEHLVRGFEFDDGTAMMLLCEWNRTCDPPWSERELRHKVQEARWKGTAVAWGAHTREERSRPPLRIVPPVIAVRESPGEGASLGMLGALLDVPELFANPEVVAKLDMLEGAYALAVAAARSGETINAVVEQTPEALREHVSRRLLTPMFGNEEDACRWFMHYARVLGRVRRTAQRESA